MKAKEAAAATSLANNHSLEVLQAKLLQFSLFNFLLLSLVGILLRAWPLVTIPFFHYKNVLHAHSHFAFGGWVMPILFTLIIKYFPELVCRIAYYHLKNITGLLFFSAYGMLLSFPFQGYAAVSIIFSTLSVLTSFYMAVVFWRASAGTAHKTSIRFLRAGIVFLVLSSIGPFATGPLIAMGKAGEPLYFNAIYFYLHFQYNGWFTFVILAVLNKMMEKNDVGINGRTAYYLFTISCVPAYFLSTLWSHPPLLFYILAMIAAILQVIAVIFWVKGVILLRWKNDWVDRIIKTAIFFFILKNLLQLLSAIPAVADLAYIQRNFIIAYLHMVLLGFVSAFALAAILKENNHYMTQAMKQGILFFAVSFFSTEALLTLHAMGMITGLPGLSYLKLLLLLSLFFPVGIFLMWRSSRKSFGWWAKNQP